MRPLILSSVILIICAALSLLGPRKNPPKVTAVERAATIPAAQSAAAASPTFNPAVFKKWLASLNRGNPADQPGRLKEGIRLLQGRKQWMAALIRTNPQRALAEALTYEQRSSLTDVMLRLIEQPLSAAAAYEVEIACALNNGTSLTRRLVTLDDGRHLEAFTFGKRLQVTCKDRISIHGVVASGVMAIDTSPVRRLGITEKRDRGLQDSRMSYGEILGNLYSFNDQEELEELEQHLLAEELMHRAITAWTAYIGS